MLPRAELAQVALKRLVEHAAKLPAWPSVLTAPAPGRTAPVPATDEPTTEAAPDDPRG
jgi:hypothetical protein